MTKHTPGPLHAYIVGKGITPGIFEHGIAHEVSGKPLARGIYNEADAKLYAAAPDMLEALIDVVEALEGRVHSRAALDALAACRAAIAKAEGRS